MHALIIQHRARDLQFDVIDEPDAEVRVGAVHIDGDPATRHVRVVRQALLERIRVRRKRSGRERDAGTIE